MAVVMFYAQNSSAALSGVPSVEQIEQAFRNALATVAADPRFASPPPPAASGPDAGIPAIGRWVGPQPRVTRETIPAFWSIAALGAIALFSNVTNVVETQAAWIYELPGGVPWTRERQELIVAELAQALTVQLESMPGRGWSGARVQPYAPALHGEVAWWRSGEAANTPTRLQPRSPISQVVAPPDNPIGRTPPETGTALQWVERLGRAALPLAAVAGAGALVVYFWPYLKSKRPGTKDRDRHPFRYNPTRGALPAGGKRRRGRPRANP